MNLIRLAPTRTFRRLLKRCNNVIQWDLFFFIDIATINVCISSLKYRKMHCHDGISNEHIIHSPPVLSVHLSLLFNSFLRHGFVPSDYCFGVILPLLKNKHGDASKLDMYRGTVSCSFSKLS